MPTKAENDADENNERAHTMQADESKRTDGHSGGYTERYIPRAEAFCWQRLHGRKPELDQ